MCRLLVPKMQFPACFKSIDIHWTALKDCDMTDLMCGAWCGDIRERTGLDMKTQGFGIDTSFDSCLRQWILRWDLTGRGGREG